jgi:hypothetical protein
MLERLKRGFIMALKAEALFYVIVLVITGVIAIVQAIF